MPRPANTRFKNAPDIQPVAAPIDAMTAVGMNDGFAEAQSLAKLSKSLEKFGGIVQNDVLKPQLSKEFDEERIVLAQQAKDRATTIQGFLDADKTGKLTAKQVIKEQGLELEDNPYVTRETNINLARHAVTYKYIPAVTLRIDEESRNGPMTMERMQAIITEERAKHMDALNGGAMPRLHFGAEADAAERQLAREVLGNVRAKTAKNFEEQLDHRLANGVDAAIKGYVEEFNPTAINELQRAYDDAVQSGGDARKIAAKIGAMITSAAEADGDESILDLLDYIQTGPAQNGKRPTLGGSQYWRLEKQNVKDKIIAAEDRKEARAERKTLIAYREQDRKIRGYLNTAALEGRDVTPADILAQGFAEGMSQADIDRITNAPAIEAARRKNAQEVAESQTTKGHVDAALTNLPEILKLSEDTYLAQIDDPQLMKVIAAHILVHPEMSGTEKHLFATAMKKMHQDAPAPKEPEDTLLNSQLATAISKDDPTVTRASLDRMFIENLLSKKNYKVLSAAVDQKLGIARDHNEKHANKWEARLNEVVNTQRMRITGVITDQANADKTKIDRKFQGLADPEGKQNAYNKIDRKAAALENRLLAQMNAAYRTNRDAHYRDYGEQGEARVASMSAASTAAANAVAGAGVGVVGAAAIGQPSTNSNAVTVGEEAARREADQMMKAVGLEDSKIIETVEKEIKQESIDEQVKKERNFNLGGKMVTVEDEIIERLDRKNYSNTTNEIKGKMLVATIQKRRRGTRRGLTDQLIKTAVARPGFPSTHTYSRFRTPLKEQPWVIKDAKAWGYLPDVYAAMLIMTDIELQGNREGKGIPLKVRNDVRGRYAQAQVTLIQHEGSLTKLMETDEFKALKEVASSTFDEHLNFTTIDEPSGLQKFRTGIRTSADKSRRLKTGEPPSDALRVVENGGKVSRTAERFRKLEQHPTLGVDIRKSYAGTGIGNMAINRVAKIEQSRDAVQFLLGRDRDDVMKNPKSHPRLKWDEVGFFRAGQISKDSISAMAKVLEDSGVLASEDVGRFATLQQRFYDMKYKNPLAENLPRQIKD